MAVPNTTTFSQDDVLDELRGNIDHTGYGLGWCFANAILSNFDSNYIGNRDRQSNFRNYGGGGVSPMPFRSSPSSYQWNYSENDKQTFLIYGIYGTPWVLVSVTGDTSRFAVVPDYQNDEVDVTPNQENHSGSAYSISIRLSCSGQSDVYISCTQLSD